MRGRVQLIIQPETQVTNWSLSDLRIYNIYKLYSTGVEEVAVTASPNRHMSLTPWKSSQVCKRNSVTIFFASGFFHESVSPQPQSIPLGLFRIFSKNRGNIRKSRCTTGVNNIGGNLPPVSKTLVANLSPVSMTPAENNGDNIRLMRP